VQPVYSITPDVEWLSELKKEINKLKKKSRAELIIELKIAEDNVKKYKKMAYTYNSFYSTGTTWKEEVEKLQRELGNRITDYQLQKDNIYTNMVDKYEKRLKEKNERLDKNYSISHLKDEEIFKLKKELDTLKGIKTYFINYGDIEKYNINKVKVDNFYISDDYTIFEFEGEDIFKIKTDLINTINME